jgi:hypothetical protein
MSAVLTSYDLCLVQSDPVITAPRQVTARGSRDLRGYWDEAEPQCGHVVNIEEIRRLSQGSPSSVPSTKAEFPPPSDSWMPYWATNTTWAALPRSAEHP